MFYARLACTVLHTDMHAQVEYLGGCALVITSVIPVSLSHMKICTIYKHAHSYGIELINTIPT